MNIRTCSVITVICFFIANLSAALAARDSDTISKVFPAKSNVTIRTVSGDCTVKKGSTDRILVDLTYRFEFKDDGWFEPEMSEGGSEIYLAEEMHGSCSGTSSWTITVPEKTEIDFSTASGSMRVEGLNSRLEARTASGDLKIAGCRGDFRVNTASGNIEIVEFSGELAAKTASGDVEARNSDGTLELHTASGDIRVEDVKGWLRMNAASGDVRASRIVVTDESVFSSASGSAVVSLSSTPGADLALSSASGSAVLKFNGNQVKGEFEFTALKHSGEISSPFNFDEESRFRRDGQEYVKKSFTRDSSNPRIKISTGSGEAVLEE